jgi:predicted  nucleic acid-binding Zn-ribbon protein
LNHWVSLDEQRWVSSAERHSLAHDEGRKGQEQVTADLRDSLKAIATENERLEGAAAAAQKHAIDLEEAKSKAEAELNQFRISADRELSQAMSTMREAGLQTTKAPQELADARGTHATQVAALSADLTIAQRNAHDFELQLVRARALLESKGQASESSLLGEPVKIEQKL